MARTKTFRRLSCYDMTHCFPAGAALEVGMGAVLNASGKVVEAGVAGISIGRVATAATAADQLVQVEQGIFSWAKSADSAIPTTADRGKPCYWFDKQTITMDDTKPFAGFIYDVDDYGVWVLSFVGMTLDTDTVA